MRLRGGLHDPKALAAITRIIDRHLVSQLVGEHTIIDHWGAPSQVAVEVRAIQRKLGTVAGIVQSTLANERLLQRFVHCRRGRAIRDRSLIALALSVAFAQAAGRPAHIIHQQTSSYAPARNFENKIFRRPLRL